VSAEDLVRFLEGLPDPEDALPDEELEGYILGIADAVRILHGRAPEHDPRAVWDEPAT
jgi:hypothetical protein